MWHLGRRVKSDLVDRLTRGEHAYFFDHWWQQRAFLLCFRSMLPLASSDATIGTDASLNQTPLGAPASTQIVDLGTPSRAWADAQLAPGAGS